jgi:hypothetical protein
MVGVVAGFLLVLLLCVTLFLCTSHRLLRSYETIGNRLLPLSYSQVSRIPQIEVTAGSKWEKEWCVLKSFCIPRDLRANNLHEMSQLLRVP